MGNQPGSTPKVPRAVAAGPRGAPVAGELPPQAAVDGGVPSFQETEAMFRLIRNFIVLRQVWRMFKRRR